MLAPPLFATLFDNLTKIPEMGIFKALLLLW